MGVLVHTIVQVLDLFLGDERMLIRVVEADQYPHDKPQHADAAEDVEDHGPTVTVQDQAGPQIGEHRAELGTSEHQRADYRSLLRRRPLRQHGVQRREGRALTEAHEDPQNGQTGMLAPADHHRR